MAVAARIIQLIYFFHTSKNCAKKNHEKNFRQIGGIKYLLSGEQELLVKRIKKYIEQHEAYNKF